jgi:hypothetical protein
MVGRITRRIRKQDDSITTSNSKPRIINPRLFILGSREIFIVDVSLRTRDTTKCADPYIVYLMVPETHSTYCPTISEAP